MLASLVAVVVEKLSFGQLYKFAQNHRRRQSLIIYCLAKMRHPRDRSNEESLIIALSGWRGFAENDIPIATEGFVFW